jgi:HIT domain
LGCREFLKYSGQLGALRPASIIPIDTRSLWTTSGNLIEPIDEYLFEPERRALNQLVDGLRTVITKEDPLMSGFNIGMNSGDAAGQTIGHAHVHLIPRHHSDVQDPRGGVRGVISGKATY